MKSAKSADKLIREMQQAVATGHPGRTLALLPQALAATEGQPSTQARLHQCAAEAWLASGDQPAAMAAMRQAWALLDADGARERPQLAGIRSELQHRIAALDPTDTPAPALSPRPPEDD